MSREARKIPVGRGGAGTVTSSRLPSRPLVPEGHKRCPTCGEVKPLDGFNRHRSRSDGREGVCRQCSSASTRRWRRDGPKPKGEQYPLRGRTEKRCPRCDEVKPEEEWARSANRYDGLASLCKACAYAASKASADTNPPSPARREERNAYSRQWRRDNLERITDRRKERYQTDPVYRERVLEGTRSRARRNRAYLAQIKAATGCVLCAEDDPDCLDFHHVDPKEKKFSFAVAVLRSRELLVAEAAKCVILCANCHRKFHAGTVAIPEHAPRAA